MSPDPDSDFYRSSISKNVGLAQKHANKNIKANKLLQEAAKSQRQWMYSFSTHCPLMIGSYGEVKQPTMQKLTHEINIQTTEQNKVTFERQQSLDLG